MILKSILHRAAFYFFLFLALFVGLCMVYGIHEKIPLRPQSLHMWRQADGLSITQNYYQRGNTFVEPEIYNLLADNNTTGRSAGEFPGLYYLIASIWKLTGKSEALFRSIVLLFTFMGLYLLFRLSKEFLKDSFQALFISLLLFTSVIFVSYSFNFLPNLPAFSLILAGWFFFWKFHQTKKNRHLWWTMLFFSLGMLLKVSSGISFFAILGWWAVELLARKDQRKIFREPGVQVLPFLLAAGIVSSWYLYAHWYNGVHHAHYTFNNLWPIWDMNPQQYQDTISAFRGTWMHEFFHITVWMGTAAMWVIVLVTWRARSSFLNYLAVIIPIGSIVYLLFWFQAFESHDYYYIEFFAAFILTWMLFFRTMNSYKWFRHWIIYMLLAGWLIYNITDFTDRFKFRYTNWMNSLYVERMEAIGELEPLLRRHGVHPDDKVISIPDESINTSLYLMNQQGYTNYGSDLNSVKGFTERMEDGADFLVINNTDMINQEIVRSFTGYFMFSHKNVYVYDLRPYKK